MRKKFEKIEKKINYENTEVEAQGCSDDCLHYSDSYAPPGEPSDTVNGSNFTACLKCTETEERDQETWPLW